MSSRIAIDVALLLPEHVVERCRKLNSMLLDEDANGFAFDETHVPHLTLVQQFADPERIGELSRVIEAIVSTAAPLELRAVKTTVGRTSVQLDVEKTSAVVDLHESLITALAPYATEGDGTAFYADSEPVRPRDVEWVRGYREGASLSDFDPHVTLGVGRSRLPVEEFAFVADRVGLCQLGRHCTCRMVLQQWILGGRPGRGA